MSTLLNVALALAEAAPTPTPEPTAPGLPNVELPDADLGMGNVRLFLAAVVAPILLVVVGIIVIGRAREGQMSKTMQTVIIAVIGAIIVGAPLTIIAMGGSLAGLFSSN